MTKSLSPLRQKKERKPTGTSTCARALGALETRRTNTASAQPRGRRPGCWGVTCELLKAQTPTQPWGRQGKRLSERPQVKAARSRGWGRGRSRPSHAGGFGTSLEGDGETGRAQPGTSLAACPAPRRFPPACAHLSSTL